jgi:hypothetical protein
MKTDLEWIAETIKYPPITHLKLQILGQLMLKDKVPLIAEVIREDN